MVVAVVAVAAAMNPVRALSPLCSRTPIRGHVLVQTEMVGHGVETFPSTRRVGKLERKEGGTGRRDWIRGRVDWQNHARFHLSAAEKSVGVVTSGCLGRPKPSRPSKIVVQL